MQTRVRPYAHPFIAAVALGTQLTLPSQGSASELFLPSDAYLSPSALYAARDGKALFVACATASLILRFDTVDGKIVDSIAVPASPSGLALSSNDTRLFVTCAAPESKVCILEPRPPESIHSSNGLRAGFRLISTIPTGHTSMAPVPSPEGKTLYVCNRFNNDVSVIDLAARKEVRRIPVRREPVAAAITPDGRFLLVANHLHEGRADQEHAAAVVSVIELAAGKVVKELPLPNGSGGLKDIRISPDGRYAAVSHIVARFNRPTTRLYYGWMNSNALTFIDLARMEVAKTLILDDPYGGAANPWGVGWSPDSRTVVIAHAGTHEVTVLGLPPSLDELPGLSLSPDPAQPSESGYMPFFFGSRHRIRLPSGDLGPRAVAVAGHTAYFANYFSDTLSVIDLTNPQAKPQSVPLSRNRWVVAQVSKPAVSPTSKSADSRTAPGASGFAGPAGLETRDTAGLEACATEMPLVRKGEFYFHDATICFEGWWSCSSCHPGDARADGLNWDLLNDGIGNPKNTKSLLLAFQTPPAMWLGVRETAETAVRAGLKHILFTQQPEEVAAAIDAYLKSLKPVLSPHLVHGKLSESAKRGKGGFTRAGCAACHPPPLFTDLHQYDVGTRRSFDGPTDRFDTPTLIELWRTAPYLHDGSATTVRDVLTTRNGHDQHGKTSALTREELDDLCAYVLSL